MKTQDRKRTKKGQWNVFLTVGLVLLLFLNGACMETVYVDANASGPGNGSPEGPFQKISTGLFWASSGATVHVAAGDYSENLIVSRPVRLLGAGAESTRLLADVTLKGIEINADDVEVRGFSIIGVGEPDPENIFIGGISAEDVNNLTVSENAVGPYAVVGIGVGRASNVVIENNRVQDISGPFNQGIIVAVAQAATVTGNTVTNVDGFGLYLDESGGELDTNAITNCPAGLWIFASNSAGTEVSLRGNVVQGSSIRAVGLFYSTISALYDNTIVNNPGIGLEIYDAETEILACGNNYISGNNPDFGDYLQYNGYLEEILTCLE